MILHILLLFYIILKFDHMMYGFWCVTETDGQTDRRMDEQTDRFFKDPQNVFRKWPIFKRGLYSHVY